MKFDDLDLAPEVMRGVRDAGFVECTPVQAQSLPWTLEGDDLAGQAQTGTGKTACFLIEILSLQKHNFSEYLYFPAKKLKVHRKRVLTRMNEFFFGLILADSNNWHTEE